MNNRYQVAIDIQLGKKKREKVEPLTDQEKRCLAQQFKWVNTDPGWRRSIYKTVCDCESH